MSGNFEKIAEILAEQLGVTKDEITLDTKIYDDLGADSLDAVEIMMAFEEEFEKETDEDFWENRELKVQDMLDLIELV